MRQAEYRYGRIEPDEGSEEKQDPEERMILRRPQFGLSRRAPGERSCRPVLAAFQRGAVLIKCQRPREWQHRDECQRQKKQSRWLNDALHGEHAHDTAKIPWLCR